MIYKFTNGYIYLLDKVIFGEVIVKDNIINYVGSTIKNDKNKYDRIIDINGKLLMPGLIDTHAHSAMTLLRGVNDNTNLQDWLFNYILPREKNLDGECIYWGTLEAIKEYVRGGITSCIDMYFYEKEAFKAFNDSGFRAKIAVTFFKTGKTLKEIKNYYNTLPKSDLVTFMSCFHSIYTVDPHDIEKEVNIASALNLDMTTHASETLKEVGDCTNKYDDLTPIGLLQDLGMFNNRSLLAHCVYAEKEDMKILEDNNVSVSINIGSNLKLGSGIPPIYSLKYNDVNLTIGTDGASSNNQLDLWKEMNLVSLVPRGELKESNILSSSEVVDMATINASRFFDNKIGEIKQGNYADLIVLDITQPNYCPITDLRNSLIYSANSKDIVLTMINGKILYENGNYYLCEDSAEIDKKVRELSKKLSKL
jgi:5-methylthioadenosine/S-adenosylhomocysteine deaminase